MGTGSIAVAYVHSAGVAVVAGVSHGYAVPRDAAVVAGAGVAIGAGVAVVEAPAVFIALAPVIPAFLARVRGVDLAVGVAAEGALDVFPAVLGAGKPVVTRWWGLSAGICRGHLRPGRLVFRAGGINRACLCPGHAGLLRRGVPERRCQKEQAEEKSAQSSFHGCLLECLSARAGRRMAPLYRKLLGRKSPGRLVYSLFKERECG